MGIPGTPEGIGNIVRDLPVRRPGETIAYWIRAELVCCRIYDRVNDDRELTFEEALRSRDWHDLCYWGEASARIAEGFDTCISKDNHPYGCGCNGAVICPICGSLDLGTEEAAGQQFLCCLRCTWSES